MTETKKKSRKALYYAFVLACFWSIGAIAPCTSKPIANKNIYKQEAVSVPKSDFGNVDAKTFELLEQCEQVSVVYYVSNVSQGGVNRRIQYNLTASEIASIKYQQSVNFIDYMINSSNNLKWDDSLYVSNVSVFFMYQENFINNVAFYSNALGVDIDIWDDEQGNSENYVIYYDERGQSNSLDYVKLNIEQQVSSINLKWLGQTRATFSDMKYDNLGGFIVGQYIDETTQNQYYYTQGQQSVIQKPSDYELYTKQDVEQVDNVAYQRGLDDGSNEKYSFLGLFKSVIQAPMYFIESAFNVEFFGFNLGEIIKTIVFLVVVAFATSIVIKVVAN